MLVRLIARMDPSRFENTVVSMTGRGRLADSLDAAGVPVFDLGMHRGRVDPRAIWRLRRIVRHTRPDLVQTWLYHADLLGTSALMLGRRIPLLWNLRCSVYDTSSYSRGVAMVRRALVVLSRVPRVIVCNSRVSRDEHTAIGYAPREWCVIPNGFETARFVPRFECREETRRRFGIAEGAPVAGIVGRDDTLKDYPTFLDAAALMRDRFPEARFVMAGRGLTADNATLSSEIARRGLSDTIVLLGEIGDPAALYPAFDVCCLSSNSESFPNVLGEAMACGIPCVTTDVGAAAEIVGDTGVVVPRRDPPALAAGIEKLLRESPEERRHRGLRARSRIEERYSLEEVARQYEELYERVFAER